MATLYLNPEGILYPRRPILCADDVRVLSANVALFDGVLAEFPSTQIVLHSWLVYEVGYHQAVGMLSPLAQERIIGATIPGNRICPFRHSSKPTRREWLRADLKRRHPPYPVLLDTDARQVLPSLIEYSLIICEWITTPLEGDAAALCELLQEVERPYTSTSPTKPLSRQEDCSKFLAG
ncbi:hypothetical protein [Cupriavidus campinensis]|uniref:Uncharacterized protein n=1 Tax=Cupriavidus campinensis TaxID=151783 RepID=A0ABY3EE39_9BURK|nr:hypothetical protein [Cupriavidus campinensis]TSP09181.1 hypothetical protein FGG12_28985 [Cupriavidus campinensis]